MNITDKMLSRQSAHQNNLNRFKSYSTKIRNTTLSKPVRQCTNQPIIQPLITPTLRSASGQGERPRRKPRVPDAPRSGMLKHIKINAHKSDRVNMIILKHKIAKKLENNAETWYNFGTNKPVLVRQRYAVVL